MKVYVLQLLSLLASVQFSTVEQEISLIGEIVVRVNCYFTVSAAVK